MRGLLRIVDKIAEASCVAAGFLVGAMMVTLSFEIVSRYFFVRPTTWALDMTEYIIVYATFMAAPWILKNRGHITVTIVIDLFSPTTRLVLEIVTSLLGLAVCVIMCVESAIDVWELFRDGIWVMRPFSVPKFTTRLPIPFGTFLLAVYFVEIVANAIVKLRNGVEKKAVVTEPL